VLAHWSNSAATGVYRTHTLLLVDKAGHCQYIEETLISDARNTNHGLSADKPPSITGKRQSEWKTTHFNFTFTHNVPA